MNRASRLNRRRIAPPAWVVVLAALNVGCGAKPASPEKPAPAATVQNAKPESDLASITLSPEAETHLALQTAAVTRVAISETRTVGGEAIVAPGRVVIITAPVAGTLSAPAGRQPVVGALAKNAVMFELMPFQPTDRDAIGVAEREAQEADARALAFDQRVRRLEGLLKEGSASQRSVEEARAERTVAVAAATAAAGKLTALRRVPMSATGALSISAPFDGAVMAIRAAAGQTVSAGAPIAEMAQVDSLWVRVPLYAGDVGLIDVSRSASVAALGRETTGPWRDVRRVSGPPTANAGAASVDLFYELSPAGPIRPGERVAVRLSLARGTSTRALVIPASAVVYDLHGGTWVYEVKAAHTFARRRVEISGPSGASLVVSRGLTEGLRIVTVGAAELYGTEFYVSK